MSGTTPEKDSSPKQKPDETQSKTTRVQATHTPKSKDESPDQNQQSQCRLTRPQQSESKRKRKRKRSHTSQSSEEPRITSPDAVVYEPNQSDEELLEKATAKSQKHMGEERTSRGIACAFVSCELKSEWMEKKFTYPRECSQPQNQQNNNQAGPASPNGPSQPGGSNPVQGNPPSRMRSRVKKFLCIGN